MASTHEKTNICVTDDFYCRFWLHKNYQMSSCWTETDLLYPKLQNLSQLSTKIEEINVWTIMSLLSKYVFRLGHVSLQNNV